MHHACRNAHRALRNTRPAPLFAYHIETRADRARRASERRARAWCIAIMALTPLAIFIAATN